MAKQWYEELYENAGESYDKELFVQGTEQEVNFFEKEINYDKSKKILDVGCGTGRHCLELARRGYSNVVGIDLSESLLERAEIKAEEERLDVNFIKRDARELKYSREFDLVLIICEGAFSLMENDEMDFKILKGVEKALKKNGIFILTTGNALFQIMQGNEYFNLETFREEFQLENTDDLGNQKKLQCAQRYYTPTEINCRLKSLGFNDVDFFGCKGGNFSRECKLTVEDYEMLIIAEK